MAGKLFSSFIVVYGSFHMPVGKFFFFVFSFYTLNFFRTFTAHFGFWKVCVFGFNDEIFFCYLDNSIENKTFLLVAGKKKSRTKQFSPEKHDFYHIISNRELVIFTRTYEVDY